MNGSANLRTRRSTLNFAAGVAQSAVSIALGFIATPFLLRWLGNERFGAFRAAADWLGHLTLLELGVAGALAPLVAAALGRNDRHGLRRLMHAGLRAYGAVALAALILAAAITATITYLVPVSPDLRLELTNACTIALAGYFLIPLGPFQVLLDAQQRSATVSLLGVVQALVTTTLALVFAHAGLDLEGQFLALLIGQGCFRVGLALAARQGAEQLRAILTEPVDPGTTALLRNLNVASFLTMLAGRVGYYADNIIIALLLGPRRVASFFLTQRLASLVGNQLFGIGNASWASLAELHALGRRDVFSARLLDLTRLIGGLAVAALVPVFAWNGAFIGRWVGAAQFAGDRLTALACVNAYLLAVLSLWGWCFGGTGLMGKMVPVALANAAVNVAVSLWATHTMGLVGPLVGTTVATVVVSLWAVPMLLARHFEIPVLGLARATVVPLLWGLPAAWGLWTWAQRHPPAGLGPLLGSMAGTGLVLLGVWWLLALTAEERAGFRSRVAAVVRRER